MMKNYYLPIILFLFTSLDIVLAYGQQPLPVAYPAGSQVNYIRTWQTKAPLTDPVAVRAAGLRAVKMSTIYADGLGRTLQTVIRKGSLPAGDTARDLVHGKVYDSEGRQSIDYLPFAANQTGGNHSVSDGGFKKNPFQQQTTYYNTRLAGQEGETSVGAQALTWACNRTIFDGSPMDRIAKVLPAGASWVGSDRGTATHYWVNTDADKVRQWKVTDVPGDWGTYASPGAYPAGTLLKNVETDELGRQVITFTDKAGRVLLSKRQGAAIADDGSGTDSIISPQCWLSTYYVYDDLGNLRLIIPPQVVEWLRWQRWNIHVVGSSWLDEVCFRYEYNGRRQVIREKRPASAEVYYVYDQRGRRVLEQDGNLRRQSADKWKYTTYDSLNRVTSTGIWTAGVPWATLKTQGENNNHYPTLTAGTYEELSFRRYDQYSNLPAGFGTTMDATNVNASTTVTSYGSAPEYAEPVTQTLNADGKLTWEGEKVLGTAQYLYKVYYYDEKGRVIQQRSFNASGSISSMTRQYNFAGQVIRTIQVHQKGGTNPSSLTVCTKTTYDDLGREVYQGQKTNPADDYKTQSTFSYDHAGKLKTKTIGVHPVSGQPMEVQEYTYHVRGWLLGMNQPFALDTNDQSKWFGYQLAYDRDGPLVYGATNLLEHKRYDGGLGRVLWKTAGDQKIRKYELSYDHSNQLISARYYQHQGSAFTETVLNFSSNAAYDCQGNLQYLVQFGWKDGGIALIDALNYKYYDGYTNKLQSVFEGSQDAHTALGDFRHSPAYDAEVPFRSADIVDYTYDDNGNLTKDRNKDIDTIRYNHLNQPTLVRVRGKGLVYYNYSAAGVKLEKIVVDSSQSPIVTTTTRYIDNFVYQSVVHSPAQPQDYVDRLQYFTHLEGCTRPIGAGVFKDDYLIRDHLGSVRMVLSDELGVDPYPTLSFEGAGGSAPVINQDMYWENKTGASIHVTAVRTARPGAFGDTTANGQQVMMVRKSTGAIGAAKLLKVMRGDRIHAYVEYFYTAANVNNSLANGIGSLLATLGSALAGNGGVAEYLKPAASDLAANLSGNGALAGLLNTNPSTSGANQAPKAYLHVLFFDEQLKFDAAASRVFPVAYSPNAKAAIDKRLANAIQAQRNGYAYVYFSNESDELVYFDNFMLSHEHSPLLEETHYYPFGLPIAAISSKAIGKLPVGFAFNGKDMQTKEFGPKNGLEWHDFGARMYDHQLGRWLSPDPHADRYEWYSPYAFGFNNPMQVGDPTGRDGVVTGSGSKDDPYVVKANYYYYNMSEKEAAIFQKALDAYNNGGKDHKVKTENGTVYVRFELKKEQATSKEDAEAQAGKDVVKEGSYQFQYGNTVTVGDIKPEENREGENAFGGGTNKSIILDKTKMQTAVDNHAGVTMEDMMEAVGIHEIGHNLGGVHGDPGNIMVDVDYTQVSAPMAPKQYRLQAAAVDIGGIRAIAGRFDTPNATIESRYISEKERQRLRERERAGSVRPTTKEHLEGNY